MQKLYVSSTYAFKTLFKVVAASVPIKFVMIGVLLQPDIEKRPRKPPFC